jgi:hypothetical protein
VRRVLTLLVPCLLGAAFAGTADAALLVGRTTSHESLAVSANGRAQITWSEGGRTRTLLVSGETLRYSGKIAGRNKATKVPPTVPFAIVQYQLPNGQQFALQKINRLGDHGELGAAELYLSRWSGDPTQVTIIASGDGRVCGAVSYHGAAVYGGAHTTAGNPLDKLGRNVYIDSQKSGAWWRIFGVLARPLGWAVLLKPDYVGSAYRATVVGPNTGGDLAPIASATVAAGSGGDCPFPMGTYKGM